ncbi:hypothetical protein DSUL_140068 [Desulfovibrionales bacterium]
MGAVVYIGLALGYSYTDGVDIWLASTERQLVAGVILGVIVHARQKCGGVDVVAP